MKKDNSTLYKSSDYFRQVMEIIITSFSNNLDRLPQVYDELRAIARPAQPKVVCEEFAENASTT